MSEAQRVLPAARHETRDIRLGPMLIAAVLMLVALALVALFAIWLYPQSTSGTSFNQPTTSFASPVLQPAPKADMAIFYASEMAYLNGTGWVDRQAGIAHIPIADAMRDVARDGIRDWPGAAPR